ncbi:hypothetical protein EMQ25_07230 [Arsenicitalea aurantiaca]|uniref:AsmA-like C-terminal domain-containing protein n=1 Tax=Arsenicitalea aurantiaca TaxID=1783274 RepID=A0A433XFM3_9HYPH|nr:hypothetical protein [Arsenicitalea aurantiaca]RUT32917.1 hypothetical protein EMQ25_07230 [Arsenicitalea aurantiaca]
MQSGKTPGRAGRRVRLAAWLAGIPIALLVTLYLILLITPIPLPFVRDQARDMVLANLSEASDLELGDMSLALENFVLPVLQFSPVVFKDKKTGGQVRMEALEVGFSPLRALVGQPGAMVTMVGPHIQMNQDLFGPRLSTLEVIDDPDGGPPTVRVLEGSDAFPAVGIGAEGVAVRGPMPGGQLGDPRSDNEWLIYNLEAMAQSLADIVLQAERGVFSRLVIRDGRMDMNDALYGLFRSFSAISLDIAPRPNGRLTEGRFSATFGGQRMAGAIAREVEEDGSSRLRADVTNVDFSAFMPFINDPEAMVSVVGTGAISIDVGFNQSGKIEEGVFDVDMTGTDLRLQTDYFPVASNIMRINWEPDDARFTLAETHLTIGRSTGRMSGVFVLGLDDAFGPTVAISVRARDVALHPNDMEAPAEPFDEMNFSGWSAPLYGAVGIDHMEARKADAQIETRGRIDMLRRGMGFDLDIGGEGVTADDLKRLWPYIIATESRDWFVKNVTEGVVKTSTMRYSFPVGTVAVPGEPPKPIPNNAIHIDMVGEGVKIQVTESMEPVAIDGDTRLLMRDDEVTIAADGATIATDGGEIGFANAALVMSAGGDDANVIEISGDVSGSIPAIVALAKSQQPDAIANADMPLDLDALEGELDLALVATITNGPEGTTPSLDYVINGTVVDFGSATPIEARSIDAGQLSFTASQAGYRVVGQAQIDGLPADVVVEGTLEGTPDMLLSATLAAEDLAAMGFDASEFLTGEVQFVARPMADGAIQMAVDITRAGLNIRDLGVTKRAGVAGKLEALIRQEGTTTELSQISLAFGNVNLRGSLDFDAEEGLRSAEFSSFALSSGDRAQLALTPIRGGYALRLRGEQLDLKPMLQRFFGLGEGSGGPQATQFTQTLSLDVELERALGFYRTTAFNVDLDMLIRGTDLQRANLQAQLGGDRSVSITTNPTPDGRVMSVAFNDFGTLLRLVGVYANIEGGIGSLVLNGNRSASVDRGTFNLRNFAIVDEDNVAQILGNHSESRQLIARQNKLSFTSGKVDFIRRSDRVEVTEGVLTGDTVGGTMRGFIYTDRRQYDLAGTYVPLFGLNNVFQKLPIFGPLLGGRDGEGLLGVTFAVRGPLDSPDFLINPVSMLVPGAFRALFEYRAREQPRPAE